VQAGKSEIADYAEALLHAGRAAGILPVLERDVGGVLALMRESEPLRRFVADPRVRDAGKGAALEELLEGRADGTLLHFLLILASRGRLADFPAIAEEFYARTAGLRENAAGEVVSAVELPPHKVAAIEGEVARILGRPVRLQPRQDAGVLGGVLVRVGSFVMDGTVRRALERCHEALTA
jgi:F-type H+-transporting ATPase subunit delta